MSCVAAMHVASTGIVDFGAVCTVLAGLVEKAGGRGAARCPGDRAARAGRPAGRRRPPAATFSPTSLINCAGLHADRVARMAGIEPPARIVPFRGEYYELRADRRHLVRGLIYPVPDPQFPFLGVHLTRMVDGSVHAGPNAVLATAREGYPWGRISPADVADGQLPRPVAAGPPALPVRPDRGAPLAVASAGSPPAWPGWCPAVTAADLVPAGAGVRAQAITPDGDLVDDFLIVDGAPAGPRAQRAVPGRDQLPGDRQAHRGPVAQLTAVSGFRAGPAGRTVLRRGHRTRRRGPDDGRGGLSGHRRYGWAGCARRPIRSPLPARRGTGGAGGHASGRPRPRAAPANCWTTPGSRPRSGSGSTLAGGQPSRARRTTCVVQHSDASRART